MALLSCYCFWPVPMPACQRLEFPERQLLSTSAHDATVVGALSDGAVSLHFMCRHTRKPRVRCMDPRSCVLVCSQRSTGNREHITPCGTCLLEVSTTLRVSRIVWQIISHSLIPGAGWLKKKTTVPNPAGLEADSHDAPKSQRQCTLTASLVLPQVPIAWRLPFASHSCTRNSWLCAQH